LTNFLNYVECHNVFPEYAENIVAAKNLLENARVELVTNRSPLPKPPRRVKLTYD